MVKITFDLNEPKDSSKNDKGAQNGHTPKSLTLEIHHGGCFTQIPSRSYVGGYVSSVNVNDIDEFCLHDLKDMMAKYVKDYKIILVYVEHGSSIFVTPKMGVSIAVDNHLRKGLIEIVSSPDVNRNLTPMCHRNLTKEWEQVSSKSLSIGEVMKMLSKKQPSGYVEAPIVVEYVDDPFKDLDEILGDYANTGKQRAWSYWKVKKVEVDADYESEEESDTERDYTSGSDSEDSDYDSKHDEVFDDDEHIVEDVRVSMNNLCFIADPKHDFSIGVVEVQEDDLDVIDYDSFGSDLDDGIDYERRIQLRELRRICKNKNKDPNKYYFNLGHQFASKERVTGRVRMHAVETRRKLIMVKNDKEMVRVRCEGTIPALVPYVAIETDMGKNEFSQIKGGLVNRENSNSGKRNILGKDKTCQGKGKKVNKQNKVDRYSCPCTMLVAYTNEGRWEVRTLDHNCLHSREIKVCTSRFLSDHIIKSLATNLDIIVRAVQDQMQKQFDVGVSKMKAFRAKRTAIDKMTDSYREQYSLLREYAQKLINQNS
ncbi:hypothetical protein Tco_0784245, partial [Tanacetum coccineum]